MLWTILFRISILVVAGGLPVAILCWLTWLIGPALEAMDGWEDTW